MGCIHVCTYMPCSVVRTSGPRRAGRRTGRGHRCSRSPRTPTLPDDAGWKQHTGEGKSNEQHTPWIRGRQAGRQGAWRQAWIQHARTDGRTSHNSRAMTATLLRRPAGDDDRGWRAARDTVGRAVRMGRKALVRWQRQAASTTRRKLRRDMVVGRGWNGGGSCLGWAYLSCDSIGWIEIGSGEGGQGLVMHAMCVYGYIVIIRVCGAILEPAAVARRIQTDAEDLDRSKQPPINRGSASSQSSAPRPTPGATLDGARVEPRLPRANDVQTR